MLSQHPKESVENRKMAGELIQRWVKQVLTQDALQVDGEDEEDEGPQGTIARKPALTMEALEQEQADSDKRRHPRIPMGSGEYNIKPVPVHQAIKRSSFQAGSNRGKLNQTLLLMARPNKKCWKPHAVSIAGRSVNVCTGP